MPQREDDSCALSPMMGSCGYAPPPSPMYVRVATSPIVNMCSWIACAPPAARALLRGSWTAPALLGQKCSLTAHCGPPVAAALLLTLLATWSVRTPCLLFIRGFGIRHFWLH